jgi:hypothetical protein
LLFTGNDKVKEPAAGEFGARVRLKFGTAELFKDVFEGTVSVWWGENAELAEVVVCERFGREWALVTPDEAVISSGDWNKPPL